MKIVHGDGNGQNMRRRECLTAETAVNGFSDWRLNGYLK